MSEGYAQNLKLTSELINGELCVDGQVKVDIDLGDMVHIDFSPQYSLRCIKFVS